MATARVRIGSRGSAGTIADPNVRAAVEAVWSRNGGRAFGATLYGTGRWSRQEFAKLLDPEFIELPFGYHPHGTVGRVAEFVAEQTGGSVEFRAPDDNLPPGTVYGAPGTLPLSEYRPLPGWLREQAEGSFQRDTTPPESG